MKRPNILLITWHDLGDFLHCYGHDDVESPYLDRLAEQGTLFENHFCTAPQCSPSRASMVTGMMPHSTGVMGLTHLGFEMHRDQVPLARFLKDASYSTHLIGTQHECGDVAWEGYEEKRSDGSEADEVAEAAIAFLKEKSRRTERPFFLAIGTRNVHRVAPDGGFPHGYDPEVADRLAPPPYLPNNETVRKDMASLYRDIKEADRHMGRIFDALDENGLAENTLVIFTSDHGPDYPHMKMTLYDHGIKTPLIMRWPGAIPAGERSDFLLSSLDIVPTISELVDVELPRKPQGRSFKGLLTGQAYEPRQELFAEITWHTTYQPLRAIRTEQYKYIINYRPGYPMIVGGAVIKQFGLELIESTYATPQPEEELYDLHQDPHEMKDVAGDPAFESVRQNLRVRLLAWLRETDDPILSGPVLHPEPEMAWPDLWVEKDGRFRIADYWTKV